MIAPRRIGSLRTGSRSNASVVGAALSRLLGPCIFIDTGMPSATAQDPHAPQGLGPHAPQGLGPHAPQGLGPHAPQGLGPHAPMGLGPHASMGVRSNPPIGLRPHAEGHTEDETLAMTPTEDEPWGSGDGELLARGAAVGRYTVLDRIGSGGMGVVYRAFDAELDRPIALKLMHAGADASVQSKARLLREAQAIAKLYHPNVITVHDVGTYGDRVFVAMEFIEGTTLRAWMEATAHDWTEIVHAFVRAGRGLAAAHAADLIHRDFKPDNVLMGRDGRVLVMDFGLARQATVAHDRDSEDESPSRPSNRVPLRDVSLTRTGATLGTPAYMAPEQHRGGRVGPLADQFSFCVALYEALYGERPFAGNSLASLAMNVLDGRLRRPPRDSQVPSWLRGVVLRGLSIDPTERYPSMDALLADLQRDPPIDRRPWVRIGLALVLLGIAVGTGYASRPTLAADCTSIATRLAGHWDDTLARRVSDALLDVKAPYAIQTTRTVTHELNTYTGIWARTFASRCSIDQQTRTEHPNAPPDAGLVCLGQRLEEFDATTDLLIQEADRVIEFAVASAQALPDPTRCLDPRKRSGETPTMFVDTGRLHAIREELAQSGALLRTGQFQLAAEHVVPIIAATNARSWPDVRAEALLLRARSLQRGMAPPGSASGRTATDRMLAEQALTDALLAAATADRGDLEAEAWIGLVDVARSRGGGDDQALALAAGAAIRRGQTGADLQAELWMHLGAWEQNRGRYRQANARFDAALEQRRQRLRSNDLRHAETEHARGLALASLSSFAAAVEAHMAGLDLREQVLGGGHPWVADSLVWLAGALLGAGREEEAEGALERARTLLTELELSGGSRSSAMVQVLDELGLVRRARERFDEAANLHRQAAELAERLGGGNQPEVAYPLENLGVALADLRRHEAAVVPLRRALALFEASLAEGHPDLAVAHLNLANSLLALGDIEEAGHHYAEALHIAESQLGVDHPFVADALTGLGRTWIEPGNAAEALNPLRRALAIRERNADDPLSIAETHLLLGRALWAAGEHGSEPFEHVAAAQAIVGAYEPADATGVRRVLAGEEVPRFTDQLAPVGLGTTHRLIR